ncbi:hypothetical protein BX600DRAFT_506936 [Xylariales sp. PMI_506]|nr:hypothetical protein BX600DRAFT_506936 [Xylariales sp. PMI_506]
MPKSNGSSDSGGGAPLHSPHSTNPNPQQPGHASADRSHSPVDEEMALIQAGRRSAYFHHNLQESPAPVRSGPSGFHQRDLQVTRTSTARPPTAFQPPTGSSYSTHQPYNGGVSLVPSAPSLPPAVTSRNPLYNGLGDIQARLVTCQQYIRMSPGISSDIAGTVHSLLVGIGQDLTHFSTTLVQEHTKSQHQAGDLRVQLEKAQNELLSRRQQIQEIQESLKLLNGEKEAACKEIASLKSQLSSYESEIQRLRNGIQGVDEKYGSQIKALKAEVERLHSPRESSMQLIKTNSVPANNDQDDTSTGSESSDVVAKPRLGNRYQIHALNPEASTFSTDDEALAPSNNVLPLLLKYSKASADKSRPSTNSRTATQRTYFSQHSGSPAARNGACNVQQSRLNEALGMRSPDVGHVMGGPLGYNHFHRDSFSSGYSSCGAEPSYVPQRQPMSYQDAYASLNDIESRLPFNKKHWEPSDVATAFMRLYEVIDGIIATQYCNGPYNDADEMLATEHPLTWKYILSMGLPNVTQSASHMSTLLSRGDCRHYVIKRVIIDYVYHRLIAPEVFFGFSEELDQHLRALQGRLRGRQADDASESSNSSHAGAARAPGMVPESNTRTDSADGPRPQGKSRQRVIKDHAKVVRFILDDPASAAFGTSLVAKHGGMLSTILRPMRSCIYDDEQATKALKVAVNIAWKITCKIWSSGMTLHFFFPETGTKFSYGTMKPMNYQHVSPETMQYSQYRIMLVISPTLSLRDDRDMRALRTHEIMKADVVSRLQLFV